MVKDKELDNALVARFVASDYIRRMSGDTLRAKIVDAMTAQGMSKAELARRSGVGYHAIDKYLKRDNAKTSAESAAAMTAALGISIDANSVYDEIRALLHQLPEEKQQFVLETLRALAAQAQPEGRD